MRRDSYYLLCVSTINRMNLSIFLIVLFICLFVNDITMLLIFFHTIFFRSYLELPKGTTKCNVQMINMMNNNNEY